MFKHDCQPDHRPGGQWRATLMAARTVIAGMLLMCGMAVARASEGATQLEHFFATVTTFQADFHQLVHDDSGQVLEDSRGEVWIKRPGGRFRWNYRAPLQQEIVSDGRRVWIYDVDLEQVTVRDVDTTLGRTPALLLAGGGDIHRSYRVAELPLRDGLTRFALTPIASDTTFSRLNIGFQAGQLAYVELADALGQTTEITFSRLRVNQPIDEALFAFKSPPGADVIDDSQP